LKRLNPNAKVTFYINGAMINDQTRPILQRMIAEGHDVDNHGYNHLSHGGAHPDSRLNGQNVILDTPEKVRDNIQRNSKTIFDATGFWPFSFRAPFFEWGNHLRGIDVELNIPFVHARYDTKDYSNQDAPQGMATSLIDAAKDGTIILMHDAPAGIRQGTVNSLQYFIPQLISQGYAFVTVRELFMIKQAQPERFHSSHETGNPNLGLPISESTTNGKRYNHEDFWPNNNDNWWLQDWWACPTPPWERMTEYEVTIDEGWRVRTETWRGIGQNCGTVITERWTVNFDLAGGTRTGGGELTQTIDNGQSATLPTVFRGGYTLTGWSGGSHQNITSNRTLVAQWEANSGGGGYQEVIGWQWTEWSTRLADNHSVGSSVAVSGENPLTAALHVGPANNVWPWVTLAAFFADNFFDNLTAVEITYTSDLPVFLSVGSTQTHGADNDAITYRHRLPAATNSTVILPLSAFTVPQWLLDAGWDRSTNLSEAPKNVIIPGLSFGHENYGQTVNITVSSIKLHGINGGTVSVTPPSRSISRASGNALAINGFNAGNLSLNIATAGMYNVSIYSVDGRVLAQTRRNLTAGANSLNIGQNLARGVVIVRIQGMDATLVRQILIR
jgi:hypothetical protein